MSTPAVITFKDDEGAFRIYQHYEGAPATVAASLIAALEFSWPLPRFEASEFAAAYIRANKISGGGIYLSNGGDGEDVSFSYIVTLQAERLAMEISKPGRLFSYTYLLPRKEDVNPLQLLHIETSLVFNQPLHPTTTEQWT